MFRSGARFDFAQTNSRVRFRFRLVHQPHIKIMITCLGAAPSELVARVSIFFFLLSLSLFLFFSLFFSLFFLLWAP